MQQNLLTLLIILVGFLGGRGGKSLVHHGIELGVLVVAAVAALAVGRTGIVQLYKIVVRGWIIRAPTTAVCGGHLARIHIGQEFVGSGHRDALGIDIQRVLDVVADCLNPVLRSAISIVCNAELTAPRGDGVGLGPQFLSFGRVVLQHFIALEFLGVGANRGCKEVDGGRGGAVEDLLGDGLAVDGHGNGLTTQVAFLVLAEVFQPFRNGEGERIATGLVVCLQRLVGLEGGKCGVRNRVREVQVATA